MIPPTGSPTRAPRPQEAGTALMIAVLTLGILIAILFQITYSTQTDARVSRNEETLRVMDDAIESVLLQVWEDLKADAEAGAAGGGDSGEGGDAGGGFGDALSGGDPEGGGEAGPTDSKEDEWSRPQRTELNEVRLRVLIQDENSKFNLLSLLTQDEDEAEKAFDRLVRVIENARKETDAEIDGSGADAIASAILEFMVRREDHDLPKPALLTDDEENKNIGLPLSTREFVALDSDLFHLDLFRDYRDTGGEIVHSLTSFLTIWTTMSTRKELEEERSQEPGGATGNDDEEEDDDGSSANPIDPEGGEGGDGGDDGGNAPEPAANASYAPVNLNTAPRAVLDALLDSRDLPYGFWDDVIEYRNEEDEDVEENEDPVLDEYGEPIIVRQFFKSVGELSEIDGWNQIEPILQNELSNLLAVQSDVFSIFVTARRPSGNDDGSEQLADKEALERSEVEGTGISRTVRCVVWRRADDDGNIQIVPIIRWEVLDYIPYEILDYPGEDR